MTAGADRFGISLAAASKRIAELEQHCGVPLLNRSQPGMADRRLQPGATARKDLVNVVSLSFNSPPSAWPILQASTNLPLALSAFA